MQSWKPKSGTMEMWLATIAIGTQHDLIEQMQQNDDGSYPIRFTVGGIDLDFSRVGKRIEEAMDEITKERAERLLEEKCSNVCKELDNMQERIKELKEHYFKFDWE